VGWDSGFRAVNSVPSEVLAMALVNVHADDAAKVAVDEAAKTLIPALDPLLDEAIDRLLNGLKNLLIGRTITIKIE
jgi:hypothetical protein